MKYLVNIAQQTRNITCRMSRRNQTKLRLKNLSSSPIDTSLCEKQPPRQPTGRINQLTIRWTKKPKLTTRAYSLTQKSQYNYFISQIYLTNFLESLFLVTKTFLVHMKDYSSLIVRNLQFCAYHSNRTKVSNVL